ncbi:hypothetical protein EFS11_07140 [Levilactobacillus brevis]|nr:hypothetical protein [Levilactobacillus brevis]
MNLFLLLILIFFQISILMINFFIIKLSFEWYKYETIIGKTFISIISSLLSLVCVLTFLGTLRMF